MKFNKSLRTVFAMVLILALALGLQGPAWAESDLYALGDTMEDFTAQLCDGTQVSLSGLLSEKKAVFLNFWASWCGPCEMEFPYMQQAYDQMSQDIAVVALSIEPTDTCEVIQQFKEDNGLTTLPMGQDPGIADRFGVAAIPTSVMVDRNGVICWMDSGAILEVEPFLNLFSVFASEDYDEPLLLEGIPEQMPAVENPSEADLSQALNAPGGNLAFSNSSNPFHWPFLPGDEGASASGAGSGGTSCVQVSVNAQAGQALAFSYKAGMWEGIDTLRARVDNQDAWFFSGSAPEWTVGYIPFSTGGVHTVSFLFSDGTLDPDHYVQIKDVSLVNQVPEDPRPRTLAGWEVEIQPLSPGVRPAVVEISGDPLVAQSMDVLVYEGSALSLRLLLGEEVDPNKAFFFDDQNLRMVGNLPYDQTGYLVDVEIPYEDGIPISLTMGPDYDTSDGMDMVTLYQSAQDLDAFVERIRNEAALYGLDTDCSWHYLDDQAAPDAQQQEGVQTQIAIVPGEYTVIYTDQNGDPVPGVMTQFCDAGTCTVVVSDETGAATFVGVDFAYEVHVLKAPDGYALPDQNYLMTPGGDVLQLTLEKQ